MTMRINKTRANKQGGADCLPAALLHGSNYRYTNDEGNSGIIKVGALQSEASRRRSTEQPKITLESRDIRCKSLCVKATFVTRSAR